MLRLLFVFVLLGVPSAAAPSAAEIARQIQEIQLDPGDCYRVFELNFSKEDLRIYLTSGYIVFAKPINGVRTGAVFTAEVEAGDAEILLLPPLRSERLSLASFTESPNLDEHFRSALLLFTDDTGEELRSQLHANSAKKVPEIGAILLEKSGSVLKNLASSFEVRIVGDTLRSNRKSGFFYMAVSGAKLGNFDVIDDPVMEEDLLIGHIAERKGKDFFDVWTSFPSRARRQGDSAQALPDVVLDNFRIDASLGADLTLKAVTRITVTPREPVGRALAFSISGKMKVLEARVDGQPAEVLQRQSLRSNLIRANDNEDFLVVTAAPLDPGKPHEFEFHHEGEVVSRAGDQVFYVGSRGNWYPQRGSAFANYDLTFRYNKDLGLVATGDIVEDRTEGDWRITRRKTTVPIRFAGFNLGNYKSASISHAGYKVEVFANRRLEDALRPKTTLPSLPPPQAWSRHRSIDPTPVNNDPGPPPPNPGARLEELARNVDSAFEYMASQFGPPPISTLTVSPIPGGFGQGFPGLLYLSTLAYLDPSQRPAGLRDRFQTTFYSEMLDAHEVAHQWFGNLVVPAGYQDAWLIEALANYSALLFLESKKGAHAVEMVLDDYRTHLLAKGEEGRTLESAGPITWGYRLQSSISPDAWHHITYEKGAWVMHMLRRRLGDDQFRAMLRAMCKRYQYKAITTEQFRQLAKEFVPPHSPDSDLAGFFDNWVYGTGIPTVKMTYAIRGLKVTGSVTQSDVADDFSARVPVEIQTGKQRALYWVATAGDPVPFTIPVKALPVKVTLSSKDALITVKK